LAAKLEKNRKKADFESGIESFVESGCVSFNRFGEKNKNVKRLREKNKQYETTRK